MAQPTELKNLVAFSYYGAKQVKCFFCDIKFWRWPVEIKRSKKQFCSKTCYFKTPKSDEFKKGVSQFWLGKKKSTGHRDMIVFKLNKWKKENRIEYINMIKKNLPSDTCGEKNGRWLGGKSFEPYSPKWTGRLKHEIRTRDKYTCQLCFIDSIGTLLAVHHINYDKQDCDSNNLITLCFSCHAKTNSNRKYWSDYFERILNNVILVI